LKFLLEIVLSYCIFRSEFVTLNKIAVFDSDCMSLN